MIDLVNLLLYSAQQLGVMLGVGAETILLVAYLLAIRDGVISEEEGRFAHAVKRVKYVGILCILVSGVAITALEFYGGQGSTVFAPAYLFKCALIGVVVLLATVTRGNTLPQGLLEGLAGGTWYALFVVHILAPVASWSQLGMLYAGWLAGTVVCWMVLVFALKGKKKFSSSAPATAKTVRPAHHFAMPKIQMPNFQMPKFAPRPAAAAPNPVVITMSTPVPPPPPAPTAAPVAMANEAAPARLAPIQPAWPQPAPLPKPEPKPVAAPAPTLTANEQKDKDNAEPQDGLPRVRVMPKSMADLQKQNRVIFN